MLLTNSKYLTIQILIGDTSDSRLLFVKTVGEKVATRIPISHNRKIIFIGIIPTVHYNATNESTVKILSYTFISL